MKIRRSPPRLADDSKTLKQKIEDAKAGGKNGENPLNFTMDMKRLGIMEDIKESRPNLKENTINTEFYTFSLTLYFMNIYVKTPPLGILINLFLYEGCTCR